MYAVVQKSGHDPVWDGFLPGARAFSSIGQANALAAYLVLALPLTASLVFGASKAVRVAAAVMTATISVAFVFTQSRGGYIGLVAVVAVLAAGWRRELHIGMVAFAAPVIGAVVLAAGVGGGSAEWPLLRMSRLVFMSTRGGSPSRS